MTLSILHVEDDSALAEIVRYAFEQFGFRGTTFTAQSVVEAKAVLDDLAARGRALDLIITDMMLPDGTGLEVVRYVRENPVWARTPILILSADADPKRVGRAYALGANCYVSKAPRGRTMRDVVKTLYEHWLKDAVLPGSTPPSRSRWFVAKAIELRSRYAAFYTHMSEQFRDSPAEVAFWLGRALREANLTNLLMFLGKRLETELPDDLLDELERAQASTERGLVAIEREISDHPIATREEAYRRLLELVSLFEVRLYARSISHMFPREPVAMGALRDLFAEYLEEVPAWLEVHSRDRGLRDRAAPLRADAATLRALA